jgi:hypothetical protein
MQRFAFLPALALVALALGLDSEAVQAQEGGWSAKDAAELKSYTLTMDKMRRTSEASAALDQLRRAREDDDDDTPQSIEAMAQRISAVPEARAVLAKHKFTAREYTVALIASAQAASAAELEAAGHKADGLPVSRQQVEFYKAHKAELDAMFAKQKAKARADDAEDDEE